MIDAHDLCVFMQRCRHRQQGCGLIVLCDAKHGTLQMMTLLRPAGSWLVCSTLFVSSCVSLGANFTALGQHSPRTMLSSLCSGVVCAIRPGHIYARHSKYRSTQLAGLLGRSHLTTAADGVVSSSPCLHCNQVCAWMAHVVDVTCPL